MNSLIESVGETLIIHLGQKDIEINLYDLLMSGSALSIFYFLFVKKSGFNNRNPTLLEKQSELEKNPNDVPYKPKAVPIPAIKGWLCDVYRKLARSYALRKLLVGMTRKQAEFDMLEQVKLPDAPTFYPIVKYATLHSPTDDDDPIKLETLIRPSDSSDDFHFNTISDYNNGYSKGTLTPLQVASNILTCIADTYEKGLNIIIGMEERHKDDIMKRAAESTKRWSMNKPLSVFDGIPVAVKDEMYLAQYPCRHGISMKVSDEEIATEDDEGGMVRKMREGGAIFIGVANQHQIGIGVTGINCSKLHGTARNPYNTDYPCGGSSSGSAAAVAVGLCPIALGGDGGGSIRIPAAACGILGAKNTFARISISGYHTLISTVIHPGPLCATLQDLRIAYGFLAGPDEDYELGLDQPPPTISMSKLTEGIKIGIDWNYFNDCSPEIRDCCKAGVDYLVQTHGMKVVDISIPELQESVRAHIITILTEMYADAQDKYEVYHNELNTDTEVFLRIAKGMTSAEYFKSQQQRTRAINIMKRLLKTVDCIITPMCGGFVPKLDSGTLKYGCLDPKGAADIMRFAVLSNFTGQPTISVPVGYSAKESLPIGIQIHTAWWEEDFLYQIADALKDFVTLRKPQIYYDVIHGQFDEVETSDFESYLVNESLLS